MREMAEADELLYSLTNARLAVKCFDNSRRFYTTAPCYKITAENACFSFIIVKIESRRR